MLGERIANLRKTKGVSQEELADILLTSRQAISKWERGESDPDINRLKDLAVCFNVSIDYLLGYDIASISVNGFIEKMKSAVKNNTFDVSLDDIRLMVSRNQNNFHLIAKILNYLSDYYGIHRTKEVVELLIEYSQKAILLYPSVPSDEISLNSIHQLIVNCYTLIDRHDLAKKYIKEQHVYDSEETLAECECELGNFEEAEKITSKAYLKAVSSIISCNLIQIRVFLRTKREREALDLTNWTIDFVESIGKDTEIFLDIIFVLKFDKASIEKSLKMDYSVSLDFLLSNRNKIKGFVKNDDGIKFYKNQQITIFTGVNDVDKMFYQEIEELEKCGVDTKDALEIYKQVFKGD